jgi:Tfp pilus assembly protein PilF
MRTLLTFVLLALATTLSAQTPVDQARALMAAQQFDKAATVLETALKTKPNDAVLHYWLGNVYGRQAQEASIFKQMSLATDTRKELERAVQLDPNYVDARLVLMEYYLIAPSMVGGDRDKAQQQAVEIRKRDAVDGHRAFARIAMIDKKPEVARAEYLAAVREQPNSARAHYWLGVFLLTTDKNFKGALDEFDAATRHDATYMPAWFQVGHAVALLGNDFARGEQALQKFLAAKPDDPPPARAHYWLGMIYEKQGKRNEARAQYQTALRMLPKQKDATEALKRVS